MIKKSLTLVFVLFLSNSAWSSQNTLRRLAYESLHNSFSFFPVTSRFSSTISEHSSQVLTNQRDEPKKNLGSWASNKILLVKGQGIGPECIEATKKVLSATGISIHYVEGVLGYPDAKDLFPLLQQKAPEIYAAQFGTEDVLSVATRLEGEAKAEAMAAGNINDFYKKLLGKLKPESLKKIKTIVTNLERQTLLDAASSSAVLKGALRTLDEGDEPSRNVTIRKAFEQYANIRRCVTLDPIVPGMKGADILFVRENVEDLYASIEHRLGRNYPQALRHQTPEGCELICRAAFEAALRDGRKKVTALEKPNILKITGGLFKEVFLRISKDYSNIKSNFMIIDDGLAGIAATPEKFDVVVTTNMFGDIGSDIAAKITGGVGLVSSNNVNPSNPKAVSMFEMMGGTADDIAGKNQANPVALIDAAAEMLLHIGGKDKIVAAEMIKTAVFEVLAEGYYVGDIKKGPYQKAKGKDKLGTQEFAEKVSEKVRELKFIKKQNPGKTFKQIALERASEEVKPFLQRVLRSYEQYADDMQISSPKWVQHAARNIPPNPVRASSKVFGFDMFVDDSGVRSVFLKDGSVDKSLSKVDPEVVHLFKTSTGIDVRSLFNEARTGSIQSMRGFGQYSARVLRAYLDDHPEKQALTFGDVIAEIGLGDDFSSRFSESLKQDDFRKVVSELESFDSESIKLIQSFYSARAKEVEPVLKENGFKLVRITSRGTEIYPTMCDFEKREIDRFRIEIDPMGPLAKIENESISNISIQLKIAAVQIEMAKKGWIIAETILNRNFIDGEGSDIGRHLQGVSVPYAKDLGLNYVEKRKLENNKTAVTKTLAQYALDEANVAIMEAQALIKSESQSLVSKILIDNLTKDRKLILEEQSKIDGNSYIHEETLERIQEAMARIQEDRQNIKIIRDHNILNGSNGVA